MSYRTGSPSCGAFSSMPEYEYEYEYEHQTGGRSPDRLSLYSGSELIQAARLVSSSGGAAATPTGGIGFSVAGSMVRRICR